MERLVLGTAQLGMPYGIANRSGRPEAADARAMIAAAWEGGIRTFDTAQGYGDSEAVLGSIIHELSLADEARVITKLDPGIDYRRRDLLVEAVDNSIRRLRVPRIHALLLHREEHLDLLKDGLAETLSDFVSEGKVGRIGVSVYSPERGMAALDEDVIEIVQLPASIVDQRAARAGIDTRAKEENKEIHVRSIFLQGLLLLDPQEVPAEVAFALPLLEEFGRLAAGFGITRREAAIGYIKQRFPASPVLFGAESPAQVKENIRSWQYDVPAALIDTAENLFREVDGRVVNPSLWRNNG
ncbi:MAG: aldo/keto reductase [Syntrophales bacterium]